MANTTAGDGWTFLDGLADAYPGIAKTDYERPRTDITAAKPEVELLGRASGAAVTRLTFRDGDVMADHRTAAPILLFGQAGTIDVTVTPAGPADSADSADDPVHLTLAPGTALHIDGGRVHSLTATGPATATLVVLTPQT
jgi:quercetin dioxygenase-like cupin family protein